MRMKRDDGKENKFTGGKNESVPLTQIKLIEPAQWPNINNNIYTNIVVNGSIVKIIEKNYMKVN